MSLSIRVQGRFGQSVNATIDRLADYCPICHVTVSPIQIGAFLNGDDIDSESLQIVNRCPKDDCGKIFLAMYAGVNQGMQHRNWYFYRTVEPGYPKYQIIPEAITTLSEAFCAIYQQANIAEAYGLKEICGTGYRKALEFLVKDFVLSDDKISDAEGKKIASMPLSQCINLHIKDTVTKEIAKRAAWLGNDETHYYKKWQDKDIEDLKKLLHITINAIDSQLIAEQYMEEMTE